MASTVTNLNLVNGQEIAIPFEVTGTCTGTGVNIVAGARMIDDNPSVDIGQFCIPVLPDSPVDFAFELTALDCPAPDTYYLLTLLFWDASTGGSSLTQTTVTFKTAPLPPKGRF